jgi:hypothetical protein
MDMIQRILDSSCGESLEYCSWEQFIRSIAKDNGMTSADTDLIYPVFGFDKRIMDEAIVVGFVIVPLWQSVSDHFCGMFFDYDVDEFEDFIKYVYEFEEHDTWESETELLLYHNRAAVIDESLQNAVDEFGYTEVVAAAIRGQYEGYSLWAGHPSDVEV